MNVSNTYTALSLQLPHATFCTISTGMIFAGSETGRFTPTDTIAGTAWASRVPVVLLNSNLQPA
jgi:hypothetical protein